MEKSTTENIVEFECLKHSYADRTTVDICGQHSVMRKGERVGLLGPNGCGKSTLLKHIVGLLKPTEGNISVFGENPVLHFDRIRQKIGVVLQDVDEQLIGPTVYDDVAFAPRNYRLSSSEIKQKVEKILADLDIQHLSSKLIQYLSGGEKRKVAIAGALVMEPSLLILDEPFENLDFRSTHATVDYLNHLNHTRGTAIIYAVHDLHLLPKISDRLILMLPGGKIGDTGLTKDLLSKADLSKYNLELPHI